MASTGPMIGTRTKPAAGPPADAPPTLARFFTRRSLRGLNADERARLTQAQVDATRPIVSGVVASGAMLLALTGMFELAGVAPDIGWPWWAVELVALTVAACAAAIWYLDDWRPRLALTVLSVLLVGIFLSVPMPGIDTTVTGRAGLFQLLPIALLALMARRVSMLAIIAAMLLIAGMRVGLHGNPPTGAAMYWLTVAVTIGFGLLLGGYRTDFAVGAFKIRQQLKHQATTDALTGLRNRAGWNREAEERYEDAVRRGKTASFAFFDIDQFKRVNDTHGHATGDLILQALGQVIRERVGAHCCAARLGGEEFVVLMVDQAPESVEGFVQRVRKEFADATRDVGCTVSAGVSHRLAAESMGQQLRRADMALYAAKSEGRDRMVVSEA
jgi:diguanylate cyclase (GGDEF)-like protein